MSIRFKFRSSLNFDTVEIDGDRDSISVRELRAKILRGTSSQQRLGFDLVFSDAATGLEYEGDDCHIPRGSSVIVKRVPGDTLPSAAQPALPVKTLSIQRAINLDPARGTEDKFDDVGADLCPVPDSNSKFEKRRTNEEMKWNKHRSSDFLEQNVSLPPELKCTLCSTFFKKAVMIPCCQHSFCEECIHRELTEKGRCPKCLSRKCKVGNLLPNAVLDRAIKHFLESQMLDGCLENDMEKYAPDGESVVQGKETLYDVDVVQRKVESPQSSSGTGIGSNQILINSSHGHHRLSMPLEDSSNGERDFQGENQPAMPLDYVQDEADTNTKRYSRYWNGGDGNFLAGGQRKNIRICYACGYPGHLMRECSNISNVRNGAFHGGFAGYAPSYWGRPYPNMYLNPGMMHFNASMVPASPYTVPFPPMTNCPPGLGGNMQVGVTGPSPYSDYFRLEQCKNRFNSNENQERRKFIDEEGDYHLKEYGKEPRFSHSEDSFLQGSGRKTQHGEHMNSSRDKRPSHHSERSNSDRHKRHRHGDSKEYSDSSLRDMKRRADPDKRRLPEKEAGHEYDSRHGEKHPRDKNHDYRPRVTTRWEEGDSRNKYRRH